MRDTEALYIAQLEARYLEVAQEAPKVTSNPTIPRRLYPCRKIQEPNHVGFVSFTKLQIQPDDRKRQGYENETRSGNPSIGEFRPLVSL